MVRRLFSRVSGALLFAASLILTAQALAQTDPLPSWNEGTAKKAIIEFVQATTTHAVGPVLITARSDIDVL